MANIDATKQATQQSYGDLYTRARQQAVRGQAAGGPTLSGGMGQQQRDFISSLEMQELGRIGSARNQAIRDINIQGQSAFSNAELEGQQATQMQLQNQQTQFQLYQQRQAILNDSSLSAEEKQTQLSLLGQPMTDAELASGQTSSDAGTAFGAAAGIAIPSAIGVGMAGKANAAAVALWNTKGKAAAQKVAFAAAKADKRNRNRNERCGYCN